MATSLGAQTGMPLNRILHDTQFFVILLYTSYSCLGFFDLEAYLNWLQKPYPGYRQWTYHEQARWGELEAMVSALLKPLLLNHMCYVHGANN